MSEKWITPQGNRSNSDLGYVPLTPKRVDPAAEWRRRAEVAEAQVQRVREVLADYVPFPDSLTAEVLRALDGDA
jgi:hypothetical protein